MGDQERAAELQVAAVEALIAPDSGLGYAPLGSIRMFRESQIREALDDPAARLSGSEGLAGVPGAGSPQNRSEGRAVPTSGAGDLTGAEQGE